ncbi:hypothetical protein J4E89_000918 [Alternaria sp. Ai002NY15]|nr:hypothetical protein J4E89_000918 [Alternaria sp. Ai002NY15]
MLVLASSEALISAFMFFHYRDPAALIDWAIAQQAFNGCMILLLDALECRTVTTGAFKAEQAFVVFKELYENSVHELAGLAVEKLSLCLQELHRLVTLSSDVQSRGERHTAMQGARHNEATRASAVTDTVMGHTGMFLLEDMSQQTAANEVSSPMAWNDPDIATQTEEHGHAGLHRGASAHPPILRPAFSSPDDIDRPTMERRSLNTPITSAENTPFNVSESFSRLVETNPRAPFTPHRAAPLQMSSIAEITPSFSSIVLGGSYGQQGQIRSQVVTYPSTAAASSSLTPMTENMNMNDWNRYAGSEGLD